jgi:hypothetical protein
MRFSMRTDLDRPLLIWIETRARAARGRQPGIVEVDDSWPGGWNLTGIAIACGGGDRSSTERLNVRHGLDRGE